MSYFLISNNDNDVNNNLNNNDDDYKLSISVYLSGLLKYVESWSHYVEINFARHNHDTDG